jgi:hypothetical protein
LHLPKEVEGDLIQHSAAFEGEIFGLTRRHLLFQIAFYPLAFQIAEANSVSHRFNREKQIAGYTWHYGFLSRYPEISPHQLQSNMMAREREFFQRKGQQL